MGVRPFYYFRSPRRLVVASEIGALFRLADIPKRLNEDRVIDYLLPIFEDTVATFYRDVVRLPPAHCLSAASDGVRTWRYWTLKPEREIRYRTDGDYAEAFRDVFNAAVKCRLRCAFPIGAMLSGGLDSSSIVCTAASIGTLTSGQLPTFSLLFDGMPSCDERQYIQAVVSKWRTKPHYIAGDSLYPFADFQQSLAHDDEPCYAPNMFLHRALYRAANEAGVRALLDGIDGDNAVSHGLARITELVSSFRFVNAAREIRATARTLGRSNWQIARKYAVSPFVPDAVRRARQAMAASRLRVLPDVILSAGLAKRALERTQMFTRPIPTTARQAHCLKLASGIFPLALETADRAAARLNVDPRYPFLDRRLLEFCVALPADQKLRNGLTRFVLRNAMNGTLPESVRLRLRKTDLSGNFNARFRLEYAAGTRPSREHGGENDPIAFWRVKTLSAWLQHTGFDSAISLGNQHGRTDADGP